MEEVVLGKPGRQYRYYDLMMAGFVTVLLCSNMIGPAKTAEVNIAGTALVFGAGNIFFPISYIFGDVLTEVYGYAKSRKVIWAGFGAMLFMTFMSWVIIKLPAAPNEPFNKVLQPAIETVFGNAWRISLGSIVAFWVGDFVNSFILAKMKVLTGGKYLWTRTIGSTLGGQLVDSLMFYPIAFYGIWTNETMIKTITFNWLFKVSVEVLFTPLTYLVVNFVKKAEDEDYFDRNTNFTPFSLES